MIKRAIFFFIAFVLCGVVSFAQNKRAEYDKLVDYVNCYYAEKYISNKISDIKNDEDKKAFEKYKKVFITSVKSYSDITIGIDNSVTNSTSVYNALKQFAKYNPKTKELWQYIDTKKSWYDESWNKEEMIEYLISLTDDEIKISGEKINFKSYLRNSTVKLKEYLQNQIPDNLFHSVNDAKKDNVEEFNSDEPGNEENKYSPSDHKNIQTTKDKERHTLKFPWGWLSFVFIIGVGFWQRKKLIPLFSFVDKLLKKQIKDKREKAVQYSNKNYKVVNRDIEIRNLNDEIRELKNENLKLRIQKNTIIQLKENVKRQIQNDPNFKNYVISLLKDCNANNNSEISKEQDAHIQNENNFSKEKNVVKENISILFADSIIDGCFNEITERPNEDTIFELTLQNAQTAKFSISPIAYARIIARPSFLDGCDKQVLNNAQKVEIINKGTAQKQTDGKWKIINKLNVIIN